MSAMQMELPGARVLDLFAGSGALGLEALSRGAAHATFVERSPRALRALRENVRTLGAEDVCTIVRGDAMAFVERLDDLDYDLALADPPYGEGLAARLAERFGEMPFAHSLWIEHRVSEPIEWPPGARSRRYGDTLLTLIPATP